MPIDTTLTEQKIQRVLGGFIASPKYRVDGLFVFGWESDRADDLRKMGLELTDDRDGEAMFATEENFKLLQKMIHDNFGPDASMSYGKIDMHSFCDERPHMREVEVRLRDLDVMQPWIDEYLERRKQSFDKERNKNKQ